MADSRIQPSRPWMGLDLDELTTLQAIARVLQGARGEIAATWREDFFARKQREGAAPSATYRFAPTLDALLERLGDGEFEAIEDLAAEFGRGLAEDDVPFDQVPYMLEYLRRSLRAAMGRRIAREDVVRGTPLIDQLVNHLVAPLARAYFGVQQAQLEARIDRLEEYHRLKDDFLSMISHELRTPLTFIQAYAETLGDELFGGLNAHERDAVDRILDGVRQLNRLVEDLLETSRIAAGKLKIVPEAFDFVQLVREEVEKVSLACHNADVAFSVEAPAEPPLVWADPTRVSQVLDNLLTNACKFTHQGAVRVTVTPLPGAVETTVRDTGQGMTPAEVAGLFQKFYQATTPRARRKGGAGLGLYITRYLLEAMGGSIQVSSEVGVGSAFTFRLPAAKPAT